MVKGPIKGAVDSGAPTAEGSRATRRDFDTFFKELTWKSDALPTALEAASIDSHLATEFSETSRRADYCVRLTDGSILHVEFQSSNESDLAWRMVNYLRLIRTKIDETCIIRQVVLFVGDEPSPNGGIQLSDGRLAYECEVRDIRAFEAQHFLESPKLDDNVLALLCHDGNSPRVLHRLRMKFDALPEDQRKDALRKLLLAGALRNMGDDVFKEFAMSMTVLRQDPFFGRILDEAEAKGVAIGEAKGRAEGWRDGLRAGETEGRVASLVGILKARGWSVADHVVDAARAADADTLGEMIATAVTIKTVEDFIRRFGLNDQPSPGR